MKSRCCDIRLRRVTEDMDQGRYHVWCCTVCGNEYRQARRLPNSRKRVNGENPIIPLYDVKMHSYIQVDDDQVSVPITSFPVLYGTKLYFYHLDGVYSFCRGVDNNPVHIGAMTMVHVIDPWWQEK